MLANASTQPSIVLLDARVPASLLSERWAAGLDRGTYVTRRPWALVDSWAL